MIGCASILGFYTSPYTTHRLSVPCTYYRVYCTFTFSWGDISLHVRVLKGHRAPRICRVLPPFPFYTTTHVDGRLKSIEVETFQIAQVDPTNMVMYHRCTKWKRKIPSCGTHWELLSCLQNYNSLVDTFKII